MVEKWAIQIPRRMQQFFKLELATIVTLSIESHGSGIGHGSGNTISDRIRFDILFTKTVLKNGIPSCTLMELVYIIVN